MDNTLKATLIAGASLFCFHPAAQAADGTINFTGEIIASGCDVNGGPAPTINVNLGRVAASTFHAVGDTASPTPFTISLTDCPPALTSASVKFDGNVDSVNSDLLAITGTATGVGVLIADDRAVEIPVFGESHTYPIDAESHSVDMGFTARLESTDAVVGEGLITAVSQFTINYQ